MKKISRYFILFFAFFSILALYSCGGGSLSDGSGGGGTTSDNITLTLNVSNDNITTTNTETGVTDITVTVKKADGTPLQKDVQLSTNMGLLSDGTTQAQEITVKTDTNGQATVQFIAQDTPGVATIKAAMDSIEEQIDVNVLKIGAVSISATKQFLFSNDSVLLTVSVKDIYNNPAKGVKVVLSSSDENSLVVGSSTITTGNDGTATIYASSKNVLSNKQVNVTAQSGDKTGGISLNIVVPSQLLLTVTPTTINSGGETATLSATVTDNSGNPTPNVTVNFTSDLGDINQNSVSTDSHGVATTYLTSNAQYGTATITATASNLTKTATLNIIQSTVVNTPNTIQVYNIESNEIYVKGSGNKETTLIEFKVMDGKGNPVSNARIQFSLVGGSIGGEYLVPSSGLTDDDGIVQTTLKAGIKPGVVKIQAWYNDNVQSNIQEIVILSGPPEGKHLSMALEKLNIIGLKQDGVSDTITARLADLYSNPVPEGTAVHFESEYSKIDGADTTTGSGTEAGVATAVLYSQSPRPVNGKPVHIWSQTQTGEYGYISSIYVQDGKIYAATDGGGLFKTTDSGNEWDNIGKPRSYSSAYKGLWGTYINSMDVDDNDNLIAVATEDKGVMISQDGGYNWSNFASRSDRYTESVSNSAILTYKPIALRERINVEDSFGNGYISWRLIGDRIFSARDAGSYTITYDINYNMPRTPAKIVKIADPHTIYAYFVGYGLYRYDMGYKYWSNYNSGLPITDISTLSLVDSNNNGKFDNIYVTIGGQVYVSSLSIMGFSRVGVAQHVTFNDSFVKGTDIYYATTEGIKKFDTTTNTWSDITITGCPKEDIKHVVLDDSDNIYIATDLGVYRIEPDGKAYPLNIYKDRVEPTADTNTLTLSYDSDMDKAHTEIYVNGIEMPSTYYDFKDEKTIQLVDGVDNITSGSIVDIYYTLKSDNYYDTASQKKITSLYCYNDKLYFGCENRKIYRIDNPGNASNGELPKIKDISGMTNKITHTLYKTTAAMFTGDTRIRAFWDSDGDGYFDYGSINVPNGGSQSIYIYVSDYNGRPLVSGSTITSSSTVGMINNISSTLPDAEYGGWGITEYKIILSDSDSSITQAVHGYITIDVKSENGNEVLSIPVTVN